jgi:hypothetical protein
MNPFNKVADSSVWYQPIDFELTDKKDPYIRIGTILRVEDDELNKDVRYVVEVADKNDTVLLWCRTMSRMGGVFNYEDFTFRGYESTPLSKLNKSFASVAGDLVLVVGLNGNTREGVILGGLKHAGRTTKMTSDEIAYAAEFNGVETLINTDGEYSLTFKGIPVNESVLKIPATGIPVPPPVYNPAITGTYMKFDKDGGWEINDKAIGLEQSIKMDKSAGSILIKGGQAEFSIEKTSQAFSLKGLTLNIEATQAISMKTLEFAVDATTAIKLKGLQVAIGSDSVELFDQLVKLIDAIGKLQPQSPVGPCTPLLADPNWPQVLQIQTQLSTVKGSL